MSANLTNSATIFNDYAFRDLVRAAAVEAAATKDLTEDRLARQIMFDADQAATIAARFVSDDESVSTNTVAGQVDDADIRRVITNRWADITAAMPGLQ